MIGYGPILYPLGTTTIVIEGEQVELRRLQACYFQSGCVKASNVRLGCDAALGSVRARNLFQAIGRTAMSCQLASEGTRMRKEAGGVE